MADPTESSWETATWHNSDTKLLYIAVHVNSYNRNPFQHTCIYTSRYWDYCSTITHKHDYIYIYILFYIYIYIYKRYSLIWLAWMSINDCKILHTVHGQSGWTLSTLPEDYESYISCSCPDSEIRVPRIEEIPIDFEECFCVDFSEAYGKPFFRTFCAGETPWRGSVSSVMGCHTLKATAATLPQVCHVAGPLQFNRPVQRNMVLGKMTKVGCTIKTLRLEASVVTSQDSWIAEVRVEGERFGDLHEVRIAMTWHYQCIYIFMHIL